MIVLLDDKICYFVTVGSRGVFAYFDKDFTTVDSPRHAFGHHTLTDAIEAQEHAIGRWGEGEIVKGRILLEQVASVHDTEIEKYMENIAIVKLTNAELTLLRRKFVREAKP